MHVLETSRLVCTELYRHRLRRAHRIDGELRRLLAGDCMTILSFFIEEDVLVVLEQSLDCIPLGLHIG